MGLCISGPQTVDSHSNTAANQQVSTAVDRSSTPAVPLQGAARYQTQQFISEGAFGSVVLATDLTTQQQVAIKHIQRGQNLSQLLYAEVTNHRRLRHPRVIEFLEVYLTPNHLCIVLEFASGGTLRKYLEQHGRMTEDNARRVFQQLVEGVDYCHRQGVVNRDLKPENTLLEFTKNSRRILIRICDFGYSKDTRQSFMNSVAGTFGYAAPEVIHNVGADAVNVRRPYNGRRADLWSLGVMLYEMLFAHHPFLDEADFDDPKHRFQRTNANVRAGRFSFPAAVSVSSEVKHLISGLLTIDPTQRLTMDDVSMHPWVRMGAHADALRKAIERNAAFVTVPVTHRQSDDEVRQILWEANQSG